jgi:cobalt-zinc-cadmium efflux system membrane fusion protein
VILISYINQLRNVDGLSVQDAAYKGALDRMRPVLMTATVAMLGLVPAAISNGIGAQSQKPFAIVIIGGLLSATMLTLIVLPTIYSIIQKGSSKDQQMTKPNPVLTHSIILFAAMTVAISCLTGCSSQDGKAMSLEKSALSFIEQKRPEQENKEDEEAKPKSTPGPLTVSLDQAQFDGSHLKITPVKKGMIVKTVDSPGRVGPNSELSRLVSTPSAGRAVEVKARLGDVVKEGQVMAIMKSDPIGQVQSDLLQNALQAKADIKQQEVQLKLSHITYERESKLYKEQVSAQADLQAAENQLEKDEANLVALKAKLEAYVKVAQERLNLLGAPPDSAKKVLAQGKIDPWVVIHAPESGLVIERAINPGEMNDGSKQLFTITDLSQVWLFADIFEKDIHDINKGDDAIVTIDSIPDRKFPARIIWVGDSVNTTTRTLPVRANVDNHALLLRPGMFARIKIHAADIPVLLIPRTAVIQKGDKTLVFIAMGNNTFQEREIETGIEDTNGVEVKRGLKAGEQVVSQGGIALFGSSLKATEGD